MSYAECIACGERCGHMETGERSCEACFVDGRTYECKLVLNILRAWHAKAEVDREPFVLIIDRIANLETS